jgi:AraC-like DNA-binding protein
MIDYHEYKPCKLIASFVDYYWTLDMPASGLYEGYEERVTPLGYPEIIIHYGDFYEEKKNSTYSQLPRILFTGQITSSKTFRPTGVTGIIGVRFKPFGSYFFIDSPISEYTDQCNDLRNIYAENKINELEEKILNAATNTERIKWVEKFLVTSLRNVKLNIPIDSVISYMQFKKGNLSIKEVAGEFHSSLSKFERNFKRAVGISPKTFSRVTRFNELLKSFKDEDNQRILNSIDYYYDQSHFIKEFISFSGFSPTEFKTINKSLTEKIAIEQNADFLQYR